MIYVTGDIHGDPRRLSSISFPEQKEMTKNDYVIILGDFGLIWDYVGESGSERYWLDWLDKKPFTTLFIDGNHECYDRLDEYPVEKWNGGNVSFIRNSVIHLKRGQVFKLQQNKVFTFGGASSHDIRDGVLDPVKDAKLIKQWNYDYTKLFRVNHRSWWERELPSEKEMAEGVYNLEKNNWEVDYILTHSPAANVLALLGNGIYKQDILTKYLEDIRTKTEYKKMFSGHMHVDRAINDKDILLYEQIVRIA